MKSVAVFCGSKKGNKEIYSLAAQQLGKLLASHQISLIYGGGKVGLMGVLADEVMKHGGHVIGIIPEKLMEYEVGHTGISELIVVKGMHERKARMNELSDGFICLPGGIGTLEEIFEVFTWAQIGYHEKPCAMLNVGGFYDPLKQMLSHTVKEGFLAEESNSQLIFNNDPEALLDKMKKVYK